MTTNPTPADVERAKDIPVDCMCNEARDFVCFNHYHIANMLAAERQAAKERACRAVCIECARGVPYDEITAHHSGWVLCTAFPIRLAFAREE